APVRRRSTGCMPPCACVPWAPRGTVLSPSPSDVGVPRRRLLPISLVRATLSCVAAPVGSGHGGSLMEAPGLDALYSEPLETFIAARNALAKALVQAADREGAAVVKALRKPSVAAWALNQLSHTRPAEVERLLAAGEELRDAQHDALEGGDPSRLREARRAHDGEVDRFAGMAAEVLSDSGKPP